MPKITEPALGNPRWKYLFCVSIIFFFCFLDFFSFWWLVLQLTIWHATVPNCTLENLVCQYIRYKQSFFVFSGIFCFFCFFLYKKPLFIRHIGVRHCHFCCHCIVWVRGYAVNAYRSNLPSSGEFYSVSRSPSDMVSTGLATQLK